MMKALRTARIWHSWNGKIGLEDSEGAPIFTMEDRPDAEVLLNYIRDAVNASVRRELENPSIDTATMAYTNNAATADHYAINTLVAAGHTDMPLTLGDVNDGWFMHVEADDEDKDRALRLLRMVVNEALCSDIAVAFGCPGIAWIRITG